MRGKITLLNKLKRKDSATNRDVWYKTILNDCEYAITSVSNVSGTTVSMGQQFTVLIPFTGKYIPYNAWKDLADKSGVYTLSSSDTIILGEVDEEITDGNIVTIKNQYEPFTCDIRSIQQVDRKLSANFEFRVMGV